VTRAGGATARALLPMAQEVRKPVIAIDLDIVGPILAILAGILILVVPRLLNYIVALYLIIVGIIGLLPYFTG
jgi:hypothetical protein